MYHYALSLSYQYFQDPIFIQRAKSFKIHAFEVVAAEKMPIDNYRAAVAAFADGELTVQSIHIPFPDAWIPAHSENIDETIANFRALMEAWAPAHPGRYTLHAGSDSDKNADRKENIRKTRAFLEELMPDLEKYNTSINIEYLPRTCLGNTPDELEEIIAGFSTNRVGICFDVNHASPRTDQVPQLIARLAPYINSFHLSDTDGIDECHWHPGQGIIDWASCMKEIKAIERDVLLILEVQHINFPGWQSSYHHNDRFADLAAMEMNVLFLENAEEMMRRRKELVIPC